MSDLDIRLKTYLAEATSFVFIVLLFSVFGAFIYGSLACFADRPEGLRILVCSAVIGLVSNYGLHLSLYYKEKYEKLEKK